MDADAARARSLEAALRLHPAVARLLAARGVAADDAASFMTPRLSGLHDPFEMRDMDRAVARTLRALQAGERIAVYGDYDVDGVSSTALLVLTLRFLGADPGYFIPHRVDDGYGMSVHQVERLASEGVRLILTVDTGIGAHAPIARAGQLGVDVVVTDHHLNEGELPPAAAVVNPNRPDAPYAGARLCGVGVAFKFAHALLKSSGRDANDCKAFLMDLLDLVALGTVADVVPLMGENRIFVRHGLQKLAASTRPGLRALLEVASVRKELTPETIGFVIGPRLNAAGRTDHASAALDLLLCEDETRALELARRLEALNRKRREDEAEILTHSLVVAEEQLTTDDDKFLVVAGEHYHLGVVGIVASRLVDRFRLPAVVLRIDPQVAKGSARSIPGFSVHEALGACDSMLLGWGGHAAAAGVQLHPSQVPGFRSAVNAYAGEIFRTRDLTPELIIDAALEPAEFGWDLYRDVQKMQPFGEQNPAPVFLLTGVSHARPPRIVGTNHLKMHVRVGGREFPAIGFNLGHLLPILGSAGSTFDVAFRPTENTWQGRTSLELSIVDARPAA